MTRLAVVLAAVLLAARPAPPLQAAGQETVEQQKRLAQVKADIDRLRQRIAEEDKKERTALSQLDRIGWNRGLLLNEGRLLEMQLDKLKLERENIRRNIPVLEADLGRRRDDLAVLLVRLSKHGRFGSVYLALESRDAASFLAAVRALELLAEAQDRWIAEYADGLAELGRADAELRVKESEISALMGKSQAKRRDLEAEEQKSRALVEGIKTNKKSYEQTLEELNLRARELQLLLQKLEARDKPEALLPFPAVPFATKKGALPWPVDGRVVQRFGPQRGGFNTLTMNNGVEIAPPKGDPTVRAVHAGKVVYTDFFPGYGNLLILEHGDSYYTLYGHCAEFLVPKEATVKAGDPIAVAGDTGSLVGVSLYLEIRHQTKPLDPLQWLGRR
ncbi:MAG: hypothetical protein FJY80_03640 [Candidatus Aminicenantes bacterium]|nr:hypothetical protein [Candidatus Aminicenantes bacterium]